MPVTVKSRRAGLECRSTIANLSEGGLCFASAIALDRGEVVELSFPLADQPFVLVGSVARCDSTSERGVFSVGVEFLRPAMSFRMKLAEQLLRIQELRAELSRERGESVSPEEAAKRWVEHYAAEFASLYS